LELVDPSSDRFDLDWVFDALIVHDHFVAGTLGCRRVRVTVHAHELFVSVGGPLAGGAFLGEGLVAAAES